MNSILGLGNPGRSYYNTRHNVGFMVVQCLSERHRVALTNRIVSATDGRPAAVSGEFQLDGRAAQLMMPLTMMNESGDAIRACRLPPQEWLLVCDDVNLPLGTLRLRGEGGPGGHHGLESCLEALQTEQVARLRLGVGAAPLPTDLHDFVLSPFPPADRQTVAQMVTQAAEACEAWLREGIDVAMNRYNRTPSET